MEEQKTGDQDYLKELNAHNHVCPHCGYCPHCGRPYRDYYPQPYPPPYPYPGGPYYWSVTTCHM
jgi:hypothetical protein